MRKQLDPRIPTLIRNNVALNHRSFFVLVGDKARDQVVNLHFLLAQSRVQSRPNVLWCYKRDLGFTSHRKKREQKIKNDIKRGIREKGEGTPFELFVSLTDIRYCYYKDTPKVLGQTYGMLVLQDFEAITPNLLARTIETVEGGGVVLLLLKTMTSLRQLYSLGMDVHRSYRSSASDDDPVARFNERFLLSLGASPDTLLLDDELNVLPLSRAKDIQPLPETDTGGSGAGSGIGGGVRKGKQRIAADQDLANLKDQVRETKVVGDVVRHAKTLDQAKAVLTILDILASSSLSTTVALTAARGRGKSAALGLCIAAAVAHGYSNIFVTSPSPENLKTLFEFVFKGLDALGYDEVADWDLQRGTGEWKDVVVRVNIFRGHRQTIQYIQPQDHQVLGQAELVVIDEAAAIPLPLVRNLMGPYLVFLSSTINGYEGTGRSLSLKLIQQLREAARGTASSTGDHDDDDSTALAATSSSSTSAGASGSKAGRKDAKGSLSTGRAAGAALAARSLKEVELKEPIRYSAGDNIESWLHELLCLDATLSRTSASALKARGCPHPSSCELYMVNRDALFSYHPASEVFLQRMMSLYVASHYKNSPNDLQLMSDAPGHRLFVLLAPLKPGDGGGLPEPLCVVQVALEGNISRQAVLNSLSRGSREAGDLIPWLVAQQFQDADFASLSGARVVRIAVHPDYASMGYGGRALQALEAFYRGQLLDADAVRDDLDSGETFAAARDRRVDGQAGLQGDEIAVRDAAKMPALLQRLSERRPEPLDWIGTSYGLTPSLFKFWKRNGYVPLWVRQLPNDLTGEYSTVQIKALAESSSGATSSGSAWLGALAKDFRRRFISLLSYRFREFTSVTALTILEAATQGAKLDAEAGQAASAPALGAAELGMLLTPFDMKRLDSYGSNMVELSVILDLVPTLAALYFNGRLRAVREDESEVQEDEEEEEELRLSALQSSLLLSIGLQRKSVDDVADELRLPAQQTMALFVKTVRLIVRSLRKVAKRDVARSMPELAGALGGRRAPARRGGGGGGGGDEATQDWTPLKSDLDGELRTAGRAFIEDHEAGQRDGDEEEQEDEGDDDEGDDDAATLEAKRKLIDSMDLSRYAIVDDDDGAQRDWSQAEKQVDKLLHSGAGGVNSTVSVKGAKRAAADEDDAASPANGGGRGAKRGGASSTGRGGKRGGGGAKTAKKARR
ncbi:related to KRE33 - essential protein, required for biogenesis of the small ribosomal subunit [Pseudozyma flocculosa]|uniref:RNA cytidine acetyltransferase n=1 Tax=Pseudozyma flocculosa TaxID=84751 RepID=A0A5C3F1K8_9BASI|nr:related to KRE33 - essential protein, required for biogenesis of the small ribosomal subunit [Pseudozyma flocculosa]